MVYKNQLVAVVKCNGKILREKDGYVGLPFWSEYSLLFKNLSSQRASIKVSIDGQDVLDGHSIIIDANSETNLEGFLKQSTAKNAFRFIKKTEEIVEHRGDKIDDGLIRIEFAFEQKVEVEKIKVIHEHWNHYCWPYIIQEHHYHHPYRYEPNWVYLNDSQPTYNATLGSSAGSASSPEIKCCGAELSSPSPEISTYVNQIQDDEGITVKGSEINQQFRNTWIGSLTQQEVLIIRLRGETETGKKIEEPVTVSTKITCKTCGKRTSSANKFCPNCGTFLE